MMSPLYSHQAHVELKNLHQIASAVVTTLMFPVDDGEDATSSQFLYSFAHAVELIEQAICIKSQGENPPVAELIS